MNATIKMRKEKETLMTKTIIAIYEDGIFKPLEEAHLPDHQRVKLRIISEDDGSLLQSQKKALLEVAGMGASGQNDVARSHDKYLYLKD
jgi:predicted DNA-binding antitoxin AbrB/MazE fold protein